MKSAPDSLTFTKLQTIKIQDFELDYRNVLIMAIDLWAVYVRLHSSGQLGLTLLIEQLPSTPWTISQKKNQEKGCQNSQIKCRKGM